MSLWPAGAQQGNASQTIKTTSWLKQLTQQAAEHEDLDYEETACQVAAAETPTWRSAFFFCTPVHRYVSDSCVEFRKDLALSFAGLAVEAPALMRAAR